MSTLRKQNLRKRGKKSGTGRRLGSPWMRALVLALRAPLRAITLCVQFCLRFPRLTTTLGIVVLLYLGGWWGLEKIKQSTNTIIPRSFEVETSDISLRTRIMRLAAMTLRETHKNSWTRDQFLAKLEERINAIENLDTAQIRAGLDGTLQIWAVPQTPKLVLELSDEQKLIIGNRLSVIGKLPSPIATANVPWLVAPEGKLTSIPVAGANGATKRGIIVGINLPWLYSCLHTIQAENGTLAAAGVSIERFYWRSMGGFSMRVQMNRKTAGDAGEASASEKTVNVVLGENDLSQKTKKLRDMMIDFYARGVTPEFIDLNYPDKAIVRLKVSEAGNETKL